MKTGAGSCGFGLVWRGAGTTSRPNGDGWTRRQRDEWREYL